MLSGDEAVWHLMRVNGGLDSLIAGEGQILSQVRQRHLNECNYLVHFCFLDSRVGMDWDWYVEVSAVVCRLFTHSTTSYIYFSHYLG